MPLSLPDFARMIVPSETGCVSLTGGGGKTTLLGVLGHTLKSLGLPVLLTTTTKVQNPFPVPTDWFVAEADPQIFIREVLEQLRPNVVGLAVKGPFGAHKWEGIPSGLVDALLARTDSGIILNEADGAFRLPIKAPADHEPVIPASTTALVPVLGLSALGKPLDKQHAFRPALISQVTGLPLGQPVTEQAMARLMIHPRGLAKGCPDGVPVYPFLNQADTPGLLAAGERIAREIFEYSGKIQRVFVGRLRPQPWVEVFERG